MKIIRLFREFPQAVAYSDFNQRERRLWVEKTSKEIPPGARILDVGAGPCQYKALFSHCDYKSQDFAKYEGTAEGALKEDWAYGAIDYISDITAIPVPDASFDAILCTEVLEHVPEPIAALQEMSRILKPGGMLYLTAPLGSGVHQAPYHFYGGYTPYFYKRFLPRFGLDILEILPNGGFFKYYAQESARVGALLITRRKLRRFSPLRLFLGSVFRRIMPIVFYHMDAKFFVEEFTVGYFVSARKLPRE